ncbi:hypothetical protein FW778_02200 [Ginsengibacter hankyongi]|uniref:DUF922 domain-containing protein n=1 Tax=Ginsengibacter hankyongi TaxID=2607284 RepID=A0A5J5IKG1_9BACT|nr:hypothetical protein [Ginsengibacter hankyongi]KAA9040873.1 hypothetical protein FW778_02200 [Ginsengibacter hankyongi]
MLRYKIYIFLLGCVAISPVCISQKVKVHAFMENRKSSTSGDTIYYDFSRSLTWADFKGRPVENYFAGAVTASGFAFDSQIDFDGTSIYLNIGVYTFFTKNDSWKKPQIHSDYHLLHEQHHFDLTMIGSEKFIDEIQKAHFTKDNYTKLLTSIFDKVYKENMDIQHLYDAQTNHSINVEKQLEWNKKIADEIQKLKQSVAIKE